MELPNNHSVDFIHSPKSRIVKIHELNLSWIEVSDSIEQKTTHKKNLNLIILKRNLKSWIFKYT